MKMDKVKKILLYNHCSFYKEHPIKNSFIYNFSVNMRYSQFGIFIVIGSLWGDRYSGVDLAGITALRNGICDK
jgi:hypothetical protein